jgi:protein-S-isoprenylcysteine O-methyltransferase Ste14
MRLGLLSMQAGRPGGPMLENELAYRIAVGSLGIAGFAMRFYFQRQFRDARRTEARNTARDKSLYWCVFAALVLPFLYAFSGLLDFAHVPVPAAVRWIGLPVGLAGLALLFATHRALGRNWSGVLEISEQHRLVVSGPYRRVRHPMYSALFCVVLSNALLSANWLIALTNLGCVTLMYFARVRDEEHMMIDQFGDEYRAYMKRTGRLIPRLR